MDNNSTVKLRGVSLFAALALIGGFLALGSPAQSVTPPGTNGLVVGETGTGLVAIDPNTSARTNLIGSSGADNDPQLNPDATRVAFESGGNIWIADFPSGNNRQQLTTGGGFARPAWSPDGTTLVFECATGLCTASASGPFPTGTTALNGTVAGDANPDYSPDGQFIVFNDAANTGIFRVNANGTGGRTGPLTGTTTNDRAPVVSPDGTRVYFANNASGINFVPFPNGGGRTLLNGTVPADDDPFPSPDGTRVGFDSGGNGFFTLNANGTGGRAQLPGSVAGDQNGHWGRQTAAATPSPTPVGQTPSPSPSPTASPGGTPGPGATPTPLPGTGNITGTVTRPAAASGGFGFFGSLFAFPFFPLFGGFGGGGSVDAGGTTPVSGAVVTVTGTSPTLTATTNAQGVYNITNVPAGQHTVTASAPAASGSGGFGFFGSLFGFGGLFGLFGGGGGSATSNCTDAAGNTNAPVTVVAGQTVTQNFTCPSSGGGLFGLFG